MSLACADKSTESFALRLSVAGYGAMAAAGFVFAALTQSGAILLDGAYSLVSLIMSLLATRIVRLLDQPDSDSFHFGYAYFEPLLNTIRGLLILMIVILGVGSAVAALLSGGRALNPGLALVYSVIIGTICLILSYTQRNYARRTGSPLLQVDARNWLIDGVLTIAVGLAFVGSLLLSWSDWSHWLPYVDPIVVIVLGCVLTPTPLAIVLSNAGQLLHVAPDEKVQREIRRRVAEATHGLALQRRDVRMVRVGRYFYVLVRLLVDRDFPRSRIAELDDIRQRIAAALADCEPQTVLDIIFTTEEHWILGLVDHARPEPAREGVTDKQGSENAGSEPPAEPSTDT